MLVIRTSSLWTKNVVPSKIKSKQSWKKPKSHDKASILISKHRIIASKAKASPIVVVLIWLGSRSLCTRPVRDILSFVLFIFLAWIVFVFLRKNGYKFILRYAAFTNWANQSFSWLIQPLVNAFPAIEMATRSDNGLCSWVKAYIAFKHGRGCTRGWLFGDYFWFLLLLWQASIWLVNIVNE